MKISELGEDGILKRIAKKMTDAVPANHIGIGDDCAYIPGSTGEGWLVTTDLLAEGVHFLKDRISPRDLGWKSLAVSLSDIASKGGSPVYAFVSLAIGTETSVEWIEAFYEGFTSLARSTGTVLMGGDTSRSAQGIFVNVTVIGRAPDDSLKLRSHAQVGDAICVTGFLGDSAAGLKGMLQSVADRALIARHHRPTPRLDEGKFLATRTEVHAMMDISDGLLKDIQRMMTAANVNARLEISTLPLSEELRALCGSMQWPAEDIALSGGEDYELLLTVDDGKFAALREEFIKKFGLPLTRIGSVTAENKLELLLNGKPYSVKTPGFEHF